MKRIRQESFAGYLTVYMTLIMAVLLSLCFALVEGARSNAIRMETEIVTDIGLNSIFAEYHRELLKQYNLFFIDSSYGTSQITYKNTLEHFKHYISGNLENDTILLYDYFYKDFLAMELKGAEFSKVSFATDQAGVILRKRAVEAIKDDVGITYLEKILDWMNVVEGYGLVERNIQQEKEKIDAEIQSYDGMEVPVMETDDKNRNDEYQRPDSETKKVTVTNPTNALERNRSVGILNLVIQDAETLSKKEVDLADFFGARKKQDNINVGNYVDASEENFISRLMFQEYLLKYLGYYGEVKEDAALSYQVEYLIAGKDNDVENLQSVVYRISALREVANAIYLFGDTEKCAAAEAMAVILATAMALPEISTLLKTTILLAWAYAESLYDVKVLLAGGKIPLLKTTEEWHYDIECIFTDLVETTEGGEEAGLDYTDYLRIFLGIEDIEKQTERFADIIEMDVRKTPGNSQFRIDGCIDSIEATLLISSKYGYQYEISRRKTYE
ncbi:DUF5702 domain-containing protein [Lachnospiraceae bacterium OttesenSCG-928-D06]|nr:DUF5702 domain-containing protein [Lachnospiraceae bacterium OttesenSCG-928-D06]